MTLTNRENRPQSKVYYCPDKTFEYANYPSERLQGYESDREDNASDYSTEEGHETYPQADCVIAKRCVFSMLDCYTDKISLWKKARKLKKKPGKSREIHSIITLM